MQDGQLTSTRIRDAREDDFERVMALYRQLQPGDPVLTDGRDRDVFRAIVGREGLHLLLLEHARGAVVSTCYLNVIPNLTRSARPYGIIENVVTDRDFRGRGFGREIITQALARAWDAGCYKVMLQTGSKRESTHAFYRACGFSGTDKHGFVAWSPASGKPEPADHG